MSPRLGNLPPDDERVPRLREPRYSQSLERGLAILGCFTPKRPVLGTAEIADGLGMSRPTTHRYVTTLAALGFLGQTAERKYRLGLRVTDLGFSALSSTGLAEQARPYLEELRRNSSYTVSIVVLDGEEILYVDRARGYRYAQIWLDLSLGSGSRLPAHCTAAGKVLLAYLPDEAQRELIQGMRLERVGPHTVTSRRALLGELEQVREDGYAISDEETAAGLYSIAAPVWSESSEVAAAVDMIALASAISLEDLVQALLPHLVSTAAQISARLGYRRADEMGKGR